jgi:hypothetical protein
MIHKHPPRPDRLRQIPPSFSWVDHRLVRHQHLRRSGPESWALYLFLVTVADAQGLSYYSEASIARYLNLDPVLIAAARQHLIQLDLLAYRKPLYQVLALPEELPNPPEQGQRSGQARTVGEILRQALGGAGPEGGQER